MLGAVGIPSPEARILDYPHRFSGGMRQRIVIAIALSCNPLLLIADEPTTNLDVTVQAEILRLIRDLKSKSGMSMIFVTHHFGLVAQICDTVAVMYAGEIVEHTDTFSLFNEPLHPYTKGLLSCIPERESQRSRLPTIAGTVPDLINVPAGCKFSPRCPNVMKRCFEKRPSLIEVRPNHFVACYLFTGVD
jgi:peptide/nickel transport system ATP-binding protein/oligopeptide transport system ATP-binding protein